MPKRGIYSSTFDVSWLHATIYMYMYKTLCAFHVQYMYRYMYICCDSKDLESWQIHANTESTCTCTCKSVYM